MSSYTPTPPKRLDPKPRRAGDPIVLLSPLAEAKMSLIIATCPTEIGWLSLLHTYTRMIDGEPTQVLVIQDAILFEQRVSPSTTELDPQSIASVAMRMLEEPNGLDRVNRLRVWGHSHVNMATSPSGQDDRQMREFAETGTGIMVRLIGNKRGDLRVDVFDLDKKQQTLSVGWSILGGSERRILGKTYQALAERVAFDVARCAHPMSWRPYTPKAAEPVSVEVAAEPVLDPPKAVSLRKTLLDLASKAFFRKRYKTDVVH